MGFATLNPSYGWHYALPASTAWLVHPHWTPLPASVIKDLKFAGFVVLMFSYLVAVIVGSPCLAESEPVRLLAAHLRAKKEKVCPIYEAV
jgi:hypothetical protein